MHRRTTTHTWLGLSLRLAIGLSMGTAAAFPIGAAAQSGDAWFGVTPPSGHAFPPQLSVLGSPAFTAQPPMVPAGEERFTELGGRRIDGYLESIVGFSRESMEGGEKMYGRVSGLPAAERTADWVANALRSAGLQSVEVQQYQSDTDMWWPDHWTVVVRERTTGSPLHEVELGSAVPARGVQIPGGVLGAPLIYAGDVGAFADVDVRGKVAVQRVKPESSAFSLRSAIQEGGQELIGRGAVAVLNYVDQPGNMHVRDFGGCGVCFNIGGADGAFLREVSERAARAGVSDAMAVHIELDAPERPRPTAQNVLGLVPGDSDEVVIVNAHLDGWYSGAGDNGDGLAVLVALARHFAQPENHPARTLLFVASGGHHSPGLNGPGHLVEMNPDLVSRAVLVLNLEHVAQYLVDPDTWEVRPEEQPMGWGVTNMAPFLVDLTRRGVDRYGFALRSDFGTGVPGDLGGYASLGVPRVQAIHAGPLYHTSADIFPTVSVNGLERAARFYAFFVDGVTKASREQIDP